MKTKSKISTSILLLLLSTTKFAYNTPLGSSSVLLETGFFSANPGMSQHIDTTDVFGDRYSADKSNDQNIIFGLSYLIDGPQIPAYNFNLRSSYGVSAHYLGRTESAGLIYIEHLAPNLAYKYNLSHFPVHAVGKIETNKINDHYSLTAETGLGPNFLTLSHYQEKSVDSISVANTAYKGRSDTVFSANLGFGVKVHEFFDQNPLECGYRLFYLGQSKLRKNNNVLIDSLKTGSIYAHSIICSVAVS